MTEWLYDIYEESNTPAEEAYRILKSNIQFCRFNKKIKTLTILSCNPGEGRTATAVNLSISLAKSGMKVLFVDADLRKPMMMKRLGSRSSVGLSNLISGHIALDDAISNTNIKGLYLLASGMKPPNPAELLGAPQFKEFLETVEEQFDMVIIDTSPMGSVIDPTIIASITDGALVIIKSKATKLFSAKRIREQLEKANVSIIGVVLNKVNKRDYKNYYNNCNYSGSEKKFNKGWFKRLKHSKKVSK